MKRIFVTGGAGFIGSHTVLELLLAGYDIMVADNLSNGHRKALERVKRLTKRDFKFVECDICDQQTLARVMVQFSPDAIIHFAGLKAVGESVREPLRYYGNNVCGSVSLLNAMDIAGCENIIFSSSATVYGDPKSLPYTEEHRTHPFNPYGQSKLMVEQILRDWVHSKQGRSSIAMRYFNPVGAHPSGEIGEHPAGVPNNLVPYLSQVAVGTRSHLDIFGDDYDTRDGTGERDYVHVVDLAKAHVAALGLVAVGVEFDVINVGTGTGTTVMELLQEFQRCSGRNIPYQVTARRSGDLASSWADSSYAQKRLGWSAEMTLKEMCRDAWNWQSKNPEGYL